VVKNEEIYVHNVDIHGRSTRNNIDFHITSAKSAVYQKSAYHMGWKICNSLPSYIKEEIHNVSHYLKTFFTVKTFIHWMNILITKRGKL
jgi:hypothetical protein